MPIYVTTAAPLAAHVVNVYRPRPEVSLPKPLPSRLAPPAVIRRASE